MPANGDRALAPSLCGQTTDEDEAATVQPRAAALQTTESLRLTGSLAGLMLIHPAIAGAVQDSTNAAASTDPILLIIAPLSATVSAQLTPSTRFRP